MLARTAWRWWNRDTDGSTRACAGTREYINMASVPNEQGVHQREHQRESYLTLLPDDLPPDHHRRRGSRGVFCLESLVFLFGTARDEDQSTVGPQASNIAALQQYYSPAVQHLHRSPTLAQQSSNTRTGSRLAVAHRSPRRGSRSPSALESNGSDGGSDCVL